MRMFLSNHNTIGINKYHRFHLMTPKCHGLLLAPPLTITALFPVILPLVPQLNTLSTSVNPWVCEHAVQFELFAGQDTAHCTVPSPLDVNIWPFGHALHISVSRHDKQLLPQAPQDPDWKSRAYPTLHWLQPIEPKLSHIRQFGSQVAQTWAEEFQYMLVWHWIHESALKHDTQLFGHGVQVSELSR